MDTKALDARMNDACEATCEWVLQKLNRRECLSVLAFLLTENDKEATIYQQASVEKAIDLAHEELAARHDLVGYVLAYDGGWMDKEKGEQRAIFLEMESRGMEQPVRCARRIEQNESGRLLFTGESYDFEPPEWSLFREANQAEAARLCQENARLRERMQQLSEENKSLEHVPLTSDWHPKFASHLMRIRQLREGNAELTKQIEFVQSQINRGEQPELWLYSHPEDSLRPRPEVSELPEEAIKRLKARVAYLADRMRHLRWRRLLDAMPRDQRMRYGWAQAQLFKKLKKLVAIGEETEIHERLRQRVEWAVCMEDLHDIEAELNRIEKFPPQPLLGKLRRDHEKLAAEAGWLEAQVNFRKKKLAEWAAEPRDDPDWIKQQEAEYETRITEMKAQRDVLEKKLWQIQHTQVNDPPKEWCDALSMHIEECRDARPIVPRETLTPEQEWQCRVIGGQIIAWWEHRYEQIVRERRFLKIKFKTAEPWLVVFTSTMSGVVAASEVFLKAPKRYIYLLDEEFSQWSKSHPDPQYEWHFHVWSRFDSQLEPDEMKRAQAKFSQIPSDQFRLNRVGEMWGSLAGGGQDHLWQWNGNGLVLLQERFGEWVS